MPCLKPLHNLNWFSQQVLDWALNNGRTGLPWQLDRTPYSVWISEVMLQQTQVATVIPYFNRFISSFPNVASLALAEEVEVLEHWSGLGYYRRAKNLHLAAQRVLDQYQGELPSSLDELVALPGIGKSTAGAILACGFNQRGVVLDGNVKRVLARCFAIPGNPVSSPAEKKLWELSDSLTPDSHNAEYVQAIMDLGSICCTKTLPNCLKCPLQTRCQAFQTNTISEYPGSKPPAKIQTKTLEFTLITDMKGRYLLQRQPEDGLWASMYLPLNGHSSEHTCFNGIEKKIRLKDSVSKIVLKDFNYQLTHRRFKVKTQLIKLDVELDEQNIGSEYFCYDPMDANSIPLPQITLRVIEQAEPYI